MGIGSDQGGAESNKLGLVGNALLSGATKGGGAQPAAVPTMDSPIKVNDVPNPSISSIASSLEQLLEVANKIATSESIRQNDLLNNLISTNRTALENLRESSPAASSANSPLTNLMPFDELAKKFELLSNVLDDKINESYSADGNNPFPDLLPDIDKPKASGSLTGLLGGAGALVGAAASTAMVAGGIIAIDQGMKAVYNNADAKSKALKEYGMKAIKNSEGFTENYEINGKRYPANKLPEDYQTILDAYGPLANPRYGTTKAALETINSNPERFNEIKQTAQSKVASVPITPSTPATFGSPEYLTGKEPNRTAESMAPQATTGVSIMTATEQSNAPMTSPYPNMLGYDPGQNMFKPQRSITTSIGRVGIGNVPTPDYIPSGKNNLGEMFQLMFFNLNYQEQ
jgi:hypothetical protein